MENRQRTFRKYYESRGNWPEPVYFKKQYSVSEKQDIWVYKENYFEQDRKTQDWSKSSDLYSDYYSEDVQPYIVR